MFQPSATLNCNASGCDISNAANLLLRQEFRIAYSRKNSNGISSSVQLVGVPQSGINFVTAGIPTGTESALSFLNALPGAVRIQFAQDDLNKRLFNTVADRINGSADRTRIEKAFAARLLEGIGGALPDGFASGAVTFKNTVTRAVTSSISHTELVNQFERMNRLDSFPNALPEWASDMQAAITSARGLSDFFDASDFVGRLPSVGGSYRLSPRAIFNSMSDEVKKNIMWRVLGAALERTRKGGMPTSFDDSRYDISNLIIPIAGESTQDYTVRLASIIGENAVLSMGEILNSPEFWYAVTNGVFGEVTDQLKDYARRMALFLAAGGTAAAAAMWLAGGVGVVDLPGSNDAKGDVPGYHPPANNWNVDFTTSHGITTQYKWGGGNFVTTPPRELAQGTKLTVRFKMDNIVRDELFTVGVSEGKKNLTVGRYYNKLVVWANENANRVYEIRADIENKITGECNRCPNGDGLGDDPSMTP